MSYEHRVQLWLRWRVVAALVAVVALSVALRVYSLEVGHMIFDGDEAVTGLMVRRILAGQQQYLYFASQTYNGSLEQYLQAAFYAVLPVTRDAFTLRLVEVALCAVTVLATYWLGRLVLGRRRYALLAALLFAVGPTWSLLLGTRSYGAYDSTQLATTLGMGCSICAVVAARADAVKPGWNAPLVRWCAGFGLCIGLVFWLGWSGFELLAPALFWILPAAVRSARALLAGVAAAIVGAIGPICWMAQHHRLVGLGGTQPHTTFGHRFDLLWKDVADEFFGMMSSPGGGHWPLVAEHSVLVGVAACWLLACVARWRGLRDVLTWRLAGRQPIDLLLFAFPIAIICYCASSYSWYAGSPRYLMVLYPSVTVALAGLVRWCTVAVAQRAAGWRLRSARWSPAWAVSAVALAVVAVGCLVTVRGVSNWARSLERQHRTSTANLQQADAWLVRHHDLHVYADYWTALPAQYLAQDPHLFVAPWRTGRQKALFARTAVDDSADFVYMTSRASGLNISRKLQRDFAQDGVRYRRTVLGSVYIYTDLEPALRPTALKLPW